ncbi:hypothetical protein QYF36_025469 [Acer negundo]|nr:hypothetical protein QYF36_025469 [Acer negundo]
MIEVVLNDRLGKKGPDPIRSESRSGTPFTRTTSLLRTMRFTMAWDSNSITTNSTFLYLYQFADIQIKLHEGECLVCSSNNAVYQTILFV